MGIQALPQTTIRTLGASQVLTDPAAVVKELLDNALDANASSITIEIHSNTLDTIQVRDNGHGIPPEDRPLVARPHCTSKIRSKNDLREIGGSSLGFRGEALASVAEMSGSLAITTRIEGEEVASLLRINPQGEVIGLERASIPVGTTIKITDFMKSHPVRKQVALKSAEKTLNKIKQLLQAYAFARPRVRLSLRLLKAKNDKGNWTYAPNPGGNAEDAAFKVVGKACASQCTWSVIEQDGFSLHAFLPRLDADPTKVGNTGAFVSVDGRPLTASRGIAKQVVKLLKEAMRTAGSRVDVSKDVFICLDIVCPVGSYDANVETAKDEVLFEETNLVVAAAKKLFAAVYPPLATAHISPEIQDSMPRPELHRSDEDKINAFELRQSIPLVTPLLMPSLVSDTHFDSTAAAASGLEDSHERSRPVFRSTMYGCDEEDLNVLGSRVIIEDTEAESEELRRARKNVTISNPWIMAKLHASQRRPVDEDDTSSPDTAASSIPRIELQTNMLLTPQPSSPPPGLSSAQLRSNLFANDSRIIGSRDLPPPVQYPQPNFQSDSGLDEQFSVSSPLAAPTSDYSLSSQAELAGIPLSAIPQASLGVRGSPQKRVHQSKINKPFKQLLRDRPEREKVWYNHLENVDRTRRLGMQKRGACHKNAVGLVTQGELGDLMEDPRPLTTPRGNTDIRDFVTSPRCQPVEDPRAALIERRRATSLNHIRPYDIAKGQENTDAAAGFVRASNLAAMAARVNEEEASPKRASKRRRFTNVHPLCELSGNNPRDYDNEGGDAGSADDCIIPRRPTEGARRKLSRRKSSRLPLERTPAGQRTHSISMKIRLTTGTIAQFARSPRDGRSLLNWDEPSVDAYNVFAIIKDSHTMTTLADKLRELLVNRVSDKEMVQDLRELVPIAFAAYERR